MNKTEKEYVYYWYHHMAISNEDKEIINGAAVTNDWETFNHYLNMYKSKCTFPDHIVVFDENDDISDIPLNKENFKLITYAECECG